MSTPTARTLARLRELGYRADVVERRLPGCLVTRDLFGIADVIAVHPGERAVLLVQATTAAHVLGNPAELLTLGAATNQPPEGATP